MLRGPTVITIDVCEGRARSKACAPRVGLNCHEIMVPKVLKCHARGKVKGMRYTCRLELSLIPTVPFLKCMRVHVCMTLPTRGCPHFPMQERARACKSEHMSKCQQQQQAGEHFKHSVATPRPSNLKTLCCGNSSREYKGRQGEGEMVCKGRQGEERGGKGM
jgi:hypothetical protein